MAELDLTNIFNDCIDHLAQGQTIDDCLRRYPQYAATLRPMLEAGLLVQRVRSQPAEVLAAQNRVRQRFDDALRAPAPRRPLGVSRFVYALAAILIIGVITVGSLSVASQDSLPGDALYGVKTFSEGLQRSLFDNDALETNFDARRVGEIQRLLALGRAEDVSFDGVITAQSGTNWVIASLPIRIPANLANATIARIGDKVQISAHTSTDHTLTATDIKITEPVSSPQPTLPPNTAIPTATVSTATNTPTITATSTSTTTSTPSLTPPPSTLAPTQTVQPNLPVAVTATPIICVVTPPDGWVTYRIVAGDTLSALAAEQSVTLTQLMTVNCITDAGHIVVGEMIFLPHTPVVVATAAPNATPTNVTSNNPSTGANPPANNPNPPSPTDDHGGGGDDHGGHGGGGDDNSGKGSGGGNSGPH